LSHKARYAVSATLSDVPVCLPAFSGNTGDRACSHCSSCMEGFASRCHHTALLPIFKRQLRHHSSAIHSMFDCNWHDIVDFLLLSAFSDIFRLHGNL